MFLKKKRRTSHGSGPVRFLHCSLLSGSSAVNSSLLKLPLAGALLSFTGRLPSEEAVPTQKQCFSFVCSAVCCCVTVSAFAERVGVIAYQHNDNALMGKRSNCRIDD